MPDDVRAALEAHAAVAGAAVVGRPDERLGETPVAMVELRAPVTTGELTDHLRNRLAHYEVPASIAVVDAIPRTPSGKPDLTAVRAHFADDAGSGRVS
jgi:acyl-CoA synthetase (AMP-forming)/AMP-acid ligase II